MKAIVTGGAGFIGSHMVELLLKEGYQVIVVDDFSNGQLDNVTLFKDNPNYQFCEMDLAKEFDDKIFQDVDFVFHMAALADIVPSIEEPVKYHEANITGTIRVLEACRKHKIKKFVYSASSSCYGLPEQYPTLETAEINPMYPYAFTKYLGEQYALFWNKLYNLPVVSLRYFNVYGTRARTNNTYGAVFKVFLKQKLENQPLTIVGDGSQTRDFVYVTDVAKANLLAAQSDVQGEIINIGRGDPQSVNYLAELIGGEKTYLPKRPGEPDQTYADITKARNLLKWDPEVSFEEGVQIMLDNIDYWKEAALWNPAEIEKATKSWFKYLGNEKINDDPKIEISKGVVKNKYDLDNVFWKDFVDLPDSPYKLDTNLTGFSCLLVFQTQEKDLSSQDYPLPLGIMASLLRMNGASVTILNEDINKYNKEVFSGYDLVCFYPMVALLSKILTFGSKVKEDYPSTKICLFNSDQHQHEKLLCSPNAVSFGRKIMEETSAIDFILIGEAETSLLGLSEKLLLRKLDFENVSSCLYRNEGEIEYSKVPIRPINFNFLPFPARDYLENGISPEGINLFSPRIQSSRGCLSPCTYCVEATSNIIAGGRKMPVLQRDMVTFVDEIELLQNKYNVVFFNIIDSSFEDMGKRGIERMSQFCEELARREIKVSFKIHLRAETVDKLDNQFLFKLKEAGVDVIGLGVESGLSKELASYRKITTVEQSERSINRLLDTGKFYQVVGHMMFSSILTLEDLPKKVEFLKQIRHTWDYLDMSNNVIIFRGNAYHKHIASLGLVKEPEKLSPVIAYSYQDERVAHVASAMGNIKVKCQEVIALQNLLYDSLNVISRFQNKFNQHLWGNKENFLIFKEEINSIKKQIGDIYSGFFLELVQLAGTTWDESKVEEIYEKWIPPKIPPLFEKTKELSDDFMVSCQSFGSTGKLYLKTWLSLINTKLNTSSGEIEQ